MDDIQLLHGMEQMETILLNTIRKMPKGFREFIIKKVMKQTQNEDSSEQFVGMLALYGLSHIFQMEKRAREEGR